MGRDRIQFIITAIFTGTVLSSPSNYSGIDNKSDYTQDGSLCSMKLEPVLLIDRQRFARYGSLVRLPHRGSECNNGIVAEAVPSRHLLTVIVHPVEVEGYGPAQSDRPADALAH